jgi:biotin-(acetyl-CoA carboxylase) ligase
MTSGEILAQVAELRAKNNLTRVESALQEPLDLSSTLGLDLAGLLLKHIDELATDELALLLGIVLTLQASQEFLAGIDNGKVDAKLLLQDFLDNFALVQTHASVIDQNGVETVTDSLSHKAGSNSRVHTTADSTQDLTGRANEVTDACDLLANELGHGPALLGTANADSKILKELAALRSV